MRVKHAPGVAEVDLRLLAGRRFHPHGDIRVGGVKAMDEAIHG